jgi:hypothetical protein
MPKQSETRHHLDLDDDALAIIVRHRPELAGKTLQEAKAILRAEFPSKKVRDPKAAKDQQ